ncbi:MULTISPECIES: hypothetical protein [Burkholderia]|uniref:hypothetical protein n=1 Tax=Burkholderia TaxID=32008 RepID=UPI00201B5BE9|nr:hypothetical protein [Burkholderia sp. LAS2]
MAERADGIRADRDSSIDSGRRRSDLLPDRKLHRPAICLALIAVLIVPLFAGCASTRSGATATVSAAARKPAPTDLTPGEPVDYAGHRCGNPNLYVKTHPCVYPQRNSPR